MNHSKAEIHDSCHQQHNYLEYSREQGTGICESSEALIASEINDTLLLEGEGVMTKPNEVFPLKNDGDKDSRMDDSISQSELQKGERLNAIIIDSDLPKILPLKRIQLQMKTCDSKLKSFASTTSVMTLDSETDASPRTTTSDGLNTDSDDSQILLQDPFVPKDQIIIDGAEKLLQQEESQNQRVVSPVQRQVGRFVLDWGRSGSDDKSNEDPEAPSHSPSSGDDRFTNHSFSDQKQMPEANWIEDKFLAGRAGIAPTPGDGTGEAVIPATGSFAFTGETYQGSMTELRESPRRVSFQDGLSSFTSLNGSSDSVQESIVSLGSSDEQALHRVNDGSVSEEGCMNNAALIDDSMCVIPFVSPPTLEIAMEEFTKESSEEPSSLFHVKGTAMDNIYPFGNLFPIEDLQQDLLACNLPQKRSLDSNDDLLRSLPMPKRFKSCQDGEQELSRDGILTLEQIFVAANAAKPVPETEPSVAKSPVKRTKRTAEQKDAARSIQFNKMYKECQSFSETHGHCAIPMKLPDNPDLADWAKKIRTAYARISRGTVTSKVISAEQVRELNKIGFCWNLKEHEWNTTFESLREQVEKHGVAGGSHTKWLKTQKKRLSSNKLTPDQAEKISSLKFTPFAGLATTCTWV